MSNDMNTTSLGDLRGSFRASARPTLSVDVERYAAFLDGADMTPAQKEEFLQALWSVIVSFVELGFEVHPLQEVCGKDAETGSERAKSAFDQVRSGASANEEEGMKPGEFAGLEVE